ncbi:S53 family peptidase [Streptomyces sp. 4503]|uniref:S53 family peptidase n=1 Tax=Streptomyces niphimycinicus TaxID=2842201 RepID=A0ABS6CFJ8_9ACTN|nr:S53 family peptidase [Streptomyces niphimycinicus]MBU3865689.1 S53 family peptidase [Streptomyces niphimycinicus]
MAASMAAGCALGGGLAAGPSAAAAASEGHPVPGGFAEQKIPDAFPTAKVGAELPDDQAVSLRVYLAGRDPKGLATLAGQVSDPKDAAHHGKYLSATEAANRFGPSDQQVKAVTDWLKNAGLTPKTATAHYVPVTGPAQKVEQALGTTLKDVTIGDPAAHVPTAVTPMTVPAEVSSSVLAIFGLAPSAWQTGAAGVHASSPVRAPASPAPGKGKGKGKVKDEQCSQWFGQKLNQDVKPYGKPVPWDLCQGYSPQQMRTAYGLSDKDTGKGTTVAVVFNGVRPDMAGDLNAWIKHHGMSPLKDGQYKEYLPTPAPKPDPDNGEHLMDVESVHAMAPEANLAYVATSGNTPGEMFDGLAKVVDQHLADVVSNSWWLGTEEQMSGDVTATYQELFQLGAVEGIGFTFGSGDAGDLSRGAMGESIPQRRAVEYPASDPWVTAVGGTSLVLDKNGTYQHETGWGSAFDSYDTQTKKWEVPLPGNLGMGSGGGVSTLFSPPAYQHGTTPPGPAHRQIPDIAADADGHTGLAIGYLNPGGSYEEYRGAGTSQSAPLIAGLMAVHQQRHGTPLGFANPTLYAKPHTAYHDVTDTPDGPDNPTAVLVPDSQPGSVGLFTFGHDLGLNATPGYDHVTGLGSPTPTFLQ